MTDKYIKLTKLYSEWGIWTIDFYQKGDGSLVSSEYNGQHIIRKSLQGGDFGTDNDA